MNRSERNRLARDHARGLMALRGKIIDERAFDRDFASFHTISKMIGRFLEQGLVNEKLLVNNVVITLNVFGYRITNDCFRLLLDDGRYAVIKAVLMFLQQHDFSLSEGIPPNRIMADILLDTCQRYHIHIDS